MLYIKTRDDVEQYIHSGVASTKTVSESVKTKRIKDDKWTTIHFSRQVADIKPSNKRSSFEVFFQKLDNFCRKTQIPQLGLFPCQNNRLHRSPQNSTVVRTHQLYMW